MCRDAMKFARHCVCLHGLHGLNSSTTVGKVAADDVPTLFKLASFCFFVNFDCQFFSRMYEREVSTADIMSDPDDDSRMLSTRERWRKIALEFFDSAVVGLETAHEGQSQDGSSRAFAFSPPLFTLAFVNEDFPLGSLCVRGSQLSEMLWVGSGSSSPLSDALLAFCGFV